MAQRLPGFPQSRHQQAILSAPRFYSFAVLSAAVGIILLTGCSGLPTASQPSQLPPIGNQIGITISPSGANLMSGGTVQFSAVVTGSNENGINWAATGGTITSGGLFTAPKVTSATNVTVSATSTANGQTKATASVSVTPAPPPSIVATSLAPATVGQAYSVTLSATGGQPPYQWSVVSGSLAADVHLDSQSGILSGTPTVAGLSAFVAAVTDQNAQSAQQTLSLLVSSASTCGPPTYPCSRSDLNAIIPTAPPQLGSDPRYYGGHRGAGMVVTDPAYGNRILRVTDGSTDTTAPGMSYGTSWSAEANLISSDESLFFALNEGSTPCLFQFDQTAFKATFLGCRHRIGAGTLQFGYTSADANALYNFLGPYLYRFVIDRNNWGISQDPAFNHNQGYFDPNGPQCLNGQLAALGTWYVHDTSLSSDDSTFIADLGPEQDVDPYVVVWNANKGCRWMNIRTWQMSQGWNTGLANPVPISWVSGSAPAGLGGMHNVQLDRSGQYAVLTINGTSLNWKVFWNVDTNTVNDTCTQCQSHWACDFGLCFWAFGPADQGFQMRHLGILPDTNMSSMMGNRDVVITPVNSSTFSNDEHASHQNASPNRKNMYLVEMGQDSGAFTVENNWDDELIGLNWDGSKRTIRFNKTWTSRYGGGCSLSPQGSYAICASDYQMYNMDLGFGNGLNQDTCDHNAPGGVRGTTGCRDDLLLFELR